MRAAPPSRRTRRRPLDRRNRRVVIEVYEEDEDVWHRVRVAAAQDRVSVRELATAVMRDWLEREEARRRDA